MTEKELVEVMYKKHKKLILSAKEAPIEWGSSYSYLNKLFGGKNAIPEKIILEKKIIPKWMNVGKKRMWKITDISQWILNTESNI